MKRLIWFSLIQVLFCSTIGLGQFGLGKLKKALDEVNKVSDLQLNEQDEIALGKEISRKIRERFGVQQDPEATRYVSLVGNVVAEKSERPGLPYHFIILDSGGINAFAAPGGYIHITRGALGAIRNEAELGGVLGHEVGHVTARHTLSEIRKMKSIELAGDETPLSSNSEVLERVADKMTEALLKGFGRKQELASDSIGVHLAAGVGYDPSGLRHFLDTLQSVNEGADDKQGLFSSHPETKDRIKKIEKLVSKGDLTEAPKAILEARYREAIKYQFDPNEIAEVVEGVKGVAGGGGKKSESGEEEEEAPPKKKSRFSLARLANPLNSGEKKETAEVTSAGAAKGVGKEGEEEQTGPHNSALVEVHVTKADVAKFKADGKLKSG